MPAKLSNLVIAWKARGGNLLALYSMRSQSYRPQTKFTFSIAASLSRHDIKPSKPSVAASISVGNDILSRLADLNADLLVMGAYGTLAHTRVRIRGSHEVYLSSHDSTDALFTLSQRAVRAAIHSSPIGSHATVVT